MSYDLGFWADPKGLHKANPSARYVDLCEMRDDGYVSSELDDFITELETRWPGESDEDFEASPWASWPLRGQATGSGIVVNTRFSADVTTVQEMVAMGHTHGLVVYDPQGDDVYGPGGLADDAGRADRRTPPLLRPAGPRPLKRFAAHPFGRVMVRFVVTVLVLGLALTLLDALGH